MFSPSFLTLIHHHHHPKTFHVLGCNHHFSFFSIFYKSLSYSTFIIFLPLIISLFFFFPI
ncbi:hypothetical protein RchiOBHm_Chr3g0462401 [Rosa chinensis]|nr:hypothetical protein RchiOBHm_Chr3g0462401 [Rosa chinensis]